MSIFDDYRKKLKDEEEEENKKSKSTSNSVKTQSNIFDNFRNTVIPQTELKSQMTDRQRDVYETSQANNGIYVSPYLKYGTEGKEKLKYANADWNALSEDERRYWLDVAEGKQERTTGKLGTVKSDDWKQSYAEQIVRDSSTSRGSSEIAKTLGGINNIYNAITGRSTQVDVSSAKTFNENEEKRTQFMSLPKNVREDLMSGNPKNSTTDFLSQYFSREDIKNLKEYATALSNAEKEDLKRQEEEERMKNPLYATFAAPAKQLAYNVFLEPIASAYTIADLAEKRNNPNGTVDPFRTGVQREAALGQYINQSINEGLEGGLELPMIGNVGQFLYNTSQSTAESAVRLAIARGVGSGLSSVVPALSAEAATGFAMNALMAPAVVNQTATELIEKGVPASQALSAAIMHGAFECLFETVSFDKLDFFDANPVVASKKEFLKNLVKAGFVEGSEEVATDIANELYDYLTMYDYSDFKAFKDTWDASRGTESTDKEAWNEYKKEFALKLAQSFAGGAVSGLSMGAVTNAQGIANARALNAKGETVTDADADRMRPIVDSVAAINPNVRNLMENAMGNETTVRGAMADVIEQMEKTYIKSIEKATTEKQLNTVMENLNTNLNGLVSETAFNAYNAKLIELGKEGADYQTFLTNRDKGNQTTFSDLAYGTGDNYISRQYAEAKSELENIAHNPNANMTMQERIESFERASIAMKKSQEMAEEIIINATKQGKTIDAPELRKYVGMIGTENAARISSIAKLENDIAQNPVKLNKGHVFQATKEEVVKRGLLSPEVAQHIRPAAYSKVENTPEYEVLKVLADMTGTNIGLFESDRSGEIQNGAWIDGKNTILVDANSGKAGMHRAIGEVLSHELTHWIRSNNEAGYDRLYMFVRKDIGAVAFDTLVNDKINESKKLAEKYNRPDLELDTNVAAEEVIAEACQRMLASSETFLRYAAADIDGAKSLLSRLKSFLGKLREFFHGEMRRDATRMIEDYEGLAAEWEKALNEAIANANTKELKQDAMIHGFDFESADDAVYRNSWRYNLTDEQIDKYSKLMSDQLGCTVKEAENYFKAADSLSSFVLDPLYNKYLDYDPDGRYTAIKKNADYPQGTVDFTNNCRKRTIFTNVFDRLQKAMPNRIFNAVTLADLRETLKKFGYKVACALCFVEDRRQRMGEIGDLYVKALTNSHKNFNNVLMYTNSKKESYPLLMTQTLKDRYGDRVPFQPGEQIVITDDYVPTQYDIVTYDGFAKLTEEHPTVALGFEAYNNRRGMSSARLIEGRGEYKREILSYTPDQVKRINDLGGLRIFSFSDFEVVHLLDLCQIITDCATVGLKIQTYTKVPAFAKLIRNTNIKCNRSLIPKGKGWDVDAKGNKYLVYDTTEGIDINDPDFFDSTDSENIGNILVGINKEQIRLAMVDDFVDYIIPFHTNQAKKVLIKKGISLWDNYKKFQTDKTASGSPTMVNIYTEVLDKYNPQNKYQFVDAFLRECQSRNITPRFEEFIDKENGKYKTVTVDGQTYMYTPGYEKFLVDFKLFDKQGNILPQKAVFPTIDMEFAKDLMKSEAATAKEQDKVDDAVVNELIEKYKDKNAKFSTRDTEYLNAIGRGDQDAAQRYVDEAAREAGYDIKAWHGSRFVFTSFDPNKRGSNTQTEASKSWFFAGDYDTANSYYPIGVMEQLMKSYPNMYKQSDIDNMRKRGIAGKLYSLYLKMENPLVVDVAGYDYAAHRQNKDAMMEFIEQAEREGRDGIILYHVKDNNLKPDAEESTVYMFRSSEQAKSADTVTYTDDGEIIPPSERFNEGKKDIRFSFRGESSTMSKADQKNLSVAREMDEQNYDSEKIRLATGWFKGMDGKWRNEVDDSGAKFKVNFISNSMFGTNEVRDAFTDAYEQARRDADSKLQALNAMARKGVTGNMQEYKDANAAWVEASKTADELDRVRLRADHGYVYLSDILDHPKLFKAYPQLKNMRVSWFQTDNGLRGVNYGGVGGISVAINRESAEDVMSTLMHEVQHEIQNIEGFSKGASPSYWAEVETPETKTIADLNRKMEKLAEELSAIELGEDAWYGQNAFELASMYAFLNKRLNDNALNPKAAEHAREDIPEIIATAEKYNLMDKFNEYAKLSEEISKAKEDAKANKGEPFDLYQRTAGEIESRDVQARLNMSSKERNATRPDIDREDVVFAKYSPREDLKNDIKAVLANKFRGKDDFLISQHTPDILTSIGVEDLPFVMKPSHVRENILTREEAEKLGLPQNERTHYHGLGIDTFYNIIRDINDIDLVYNGTKTARDPKRRTNYYLLVTKYNDADGNPIVIAVYTNEPGGVNEAIVQTNKVATVFGKENFDTFIRNALKYNDLVRKTIKKKASTAVIGTGLNTGGYADDSFNNKISQSEADVKRFSTRDSEGNTLTESQAEYFADSKVRDADGNLMVMWHGTDAEFNTFDMSKGRSTMDIQGSFFSPWEIDAKGYGDNVRRFYLNIKNPANESVAYRALNRFKGQNNAGVKAREYLISQGYDGVINGADGEIEEVIAFYPNQIKEVENAAPTENPDVRFSYRDLANSESEILINALKNDAALVDELGAKQSIEAYAREYNRLKEMEQQQIDITKQLNKKGTSPSEREVLLKKMVRLDRAILNKTTELTEMRNQRVIRDLLISEWDKRDTLVAAGRAEERYLTRKALEEKYGKELSALKEKTRQQKQDIRDRHTINERKANIIKKTKQLMDMCLHPTEKKKVPTVLINPVVELLDAIDYWTPAEGRRVTKKSESLRERFVNFREAINEYQEQINEGTEQIEYMFDPEFLETVDELAKSVKGINNVNDMNAEEITALDQTLTQLYHLISRGNKMITASHYQTVNEYTDKTRQAMEKRKTLSEKTSAKGNWLTRLNAGMADTYAFGEYAGEGTREIVDMLSKAFEDKEFHVKEAIEFTQEVLKPYKKELKKWSQDEHEFTLSTTDKDGNPNKVKLTVGQMMELYLLNKREQARGHIYGGGIRVENRKGKFTESVKIAEQDVAEIMEYLKSVPGAMEVADKLQQYGATTITGWGNQASNLMYGISKFTDENYWQIRSDSSALKDNENTEKALNASMYRLQNMGRTKAVKKGANNAIYIGDVFDTWSKTIDEMTSYASILPATTDAMRWWNSRVELDGENAVRVKKLLESKLGTDMTRVFTDTIKALNGGIMGTDSLESLVKKLTGKAKAAAVAGNLRVVLQQPTAYTRAAAVIDKKYLLKALMTKPNAKEAQEHSAIAWHKAQGFYSNGLAPSLRKMVIGDASIGENLTEKALWLAGKADDLTWGYLWNASKLKVEAENKALKVGSDAYWNEVNKVFSNIINQTQVVDTPLTKSTWMRGNGLGVYFTAFMAEPTKTYSMVMERLDRVLQNPTSKDAWRAFAGVGAVFAVNAMVNAMAQALADAARDDDKEKDYWEKYIEKYQEDVKDNINPLTYIPVVKDIWSLSQGYSNSNLSMQAAQNTVYAVNELKKIANGTSKKTLFGQAETVAKAVSGWTGIPVGNVMRTLNSIGNVAGVDIFRRKKYTNSELGRNVVLSMNEGDTSAADKYMAELVENCKGDTNKANNYVITYLADHDNEIDAWAEKYMEDATTINDAIDAMSDKYSAEIVTKAIRKSVNNDADEDDKIKTSTLAESQYTSDDINRMLENGKVTEAQDIIDEVNAKYKEMGSKTTAKNAVTAYWKPKYLAASGAERDKILKMLYKLKNNGQQMYSSKDIAKWS